ncbi:MAG: TMEM175 family protein [Chloroflexota bacterium]
MRPAPALSGANRLEAFSDGVFAIIVTLLIFEIKVPQLTTLDNATVGAELARLAPKLISFAVSFFTLAIFWVNHHHFFHAITHSDWRLLWHNNLLLFWLTIVPFTTAFIGDYPTQPLVVALYAFGMGMAALSFSLMGKYVFFTSALMSPTISMDERRAEFRRSLVGTGMYVFATLCAFVFVYLSLLIMVLIPIFYVVPGLVREAQPES